MVRTRAPFETCYVNQSKAQTWPNHLIENGFPNPLAIPHENKTRGIPS